MGDSAIGPCDDCGKPAEWFCSSGKQCHKCYVAFLKAAGCVFIDSNLKCNRAMRGCDIEHDDGFI